MNIAPGVWYAVLAVELIAAGFVMFELWRAPTLDHLDEDYGKADQFKD